VNLPETEFQWAQRRAQEEANLNGVPFTIFKVRGTGRHMSISETRVGDSTRPDFVMIVNPMEKKP
jgi:hypothetical protein